MHWEIREVQGPDAEPFLEGLAGLRIRVFRDFPYLYDGDLAYERSYLSTYFACTDSYVALCLSNGTLVGAATALPLKDGEREVQAPFLKAGINTANICYYGESVLLPELRGYGIGREFMKRRERYARALPGVTRATFCAVIRENNHSHRPERYSPLDAFWKSEGFSPIPGLQAAFSWKDLGAAENTKKQMQFWIKTLNSQKEDR